jgi:hypothetical protein
MRCETCNHWCRSNHPDLEEDFGICDMQIIDIVITRARHKCLSWEGAGNDDELGCTCLAGEGATCPEHSNR